MEQVTLWLSQNLWVLLGLLIPFAWPILKAKFPLVGGALSWLLSRTKTKPEQTDEDLLLELLKKLSEKHEVAPPVSDPLDTKSEVLQGLIDRLKQLGADKLKQLEDKLAGLKATVAK